jgi:hypothetical protein
MNTTGSWGTWDVERLNAIMKVPDLAQVRIAFYDQKFKKYVDQMLWKYVSRFGEHSLDGTYFDLDLRYEDLTCKVEFASDGDVFVYKLTPDKSWDRLKFHISGMYRWNARGSVSRLEDVLLLSSEAGQYAVSVVGHEPEEQTPINTDYVGFLMPCSGSLYIRCNHRMDAEEMDDFLQERREAWLRSASSGSGMLEDAPQAIFKGMIWNTIYDPTKQRFCTPVTREWCVMSNMTHFGGYVLFSWDTLLCSLLAAVQDKGLAYRQVYSVLEEMQDDFAPQYGSQVLTRWDRSNPPVGAYSVLKLYRQFQELELLEAVYDRFLAWNRWWMTHRDGNGDGLLEWGSHREYVENAEVVLHESFEVASKMESGLDNSPMYDGIRYNPGGRTLELADVGLNALYALDCRSMAEIADILGKTEDAHALRLEYDRMVAFINSELWNEELGIYCNKHWDGSFSDVLTPALFYPLAAGAATPERARTMLERHLLNEEEFWGEYPLPSVAKTHPAFADNDYWRGRVWGPMNFLVNEGLKAYGYEQHSYELARRSLRMFLKEWREDNHIHENYNAISGDGDDVYNADPVYTWGGLLPYLYLQELIDPLPWGGIRFGNGSGEEAGLSGIMIGDSRFAVQAGAELGVTRDGEAFIHADVPAVVIWTQGADGTEIFDVRAIKPGTLTITSRERGGAPVAVRYNGTEVNVSPNPEGIVQVLLQGSEVAT